MFSHSEPINKILNNLNQEKPTNEAVSNSKTLLWQMRKESFRSQYFQYMLVLFPLPFQVYQGLSNNKNELH